MHFTKAVILVVKWTLASLACSKTILFAGDLQGSKSTSGGVLDILGVSNVRANFVDAHKSKQQPLTAAQRQI